jgi:hypothetical protein
LRKRRATECVRVWAKKASVSARGRPVAQRWPAAARGREIPKRPIREGPSTDAGHRGGPPRGSDEAR